MILQLPAVEASEPLSVDLRVTLNAFLVVLNSDVERWLTDVTVVNGPSEISFHLTAVVAFGEYAGDAVQDNLAEQRIDQRVPC